MASLSPRIFILDDQTIFRECVVAVLGLEKDFQVVGHVGTAAQARSLLPKCKPNIILLESRLDGTSGLDLLPEIPGLSPGCKTIVMASAGVEKDIVRAMRLGARGFLAKQSATELFLRCIRKVHEGEVWLDGRMTDVVLQTLSGKQPVSSSDEKAGLSRRELEVIQLVTQGYKNRDIAKKLFISEKTVKNHLSAIFNKLGVNDRLELTLYVFEKKFFPSTLP